MSTPPEPTGTPAIATGADRSSLRPRRWEMAFLLVVATLLSVQLFVPPLVGLADNGDFSRTMWPSGISTPPVPVPYFQYFISKYAYDPLDTRPVQFISSERLFVRLAVILHRLSGDGPVFDIRLLAAVHAAALLAALWLIAVATRGYPPPGRIVILVLLVVAFSDPAFAAYLNSFYSEAASLVFLLASVGMMALVIAGRRRVAALVTTTACVALLVAAKPQNFVAALPMAAVLLRFGALRRDTLWRGSCAAAAAMTLGTGGLMFWRGNSPQIRELAMQVAVFHAILPGSPDPRSDLQELGLPPKLVVFSGLHPWASGAPSRTDPVFRRQFVDRMTAGKLLRFYLKHPARLWMVTDAVAREAFYPRPPLGNYEASTGRPPLAISTRFAWWSAASIRLAPRSLLALLALHGAFLAAGAILWAVRPQLNRQGIELFCALSLIAVLQLPVIAISMGPIDAVKHTFLFKATTALCLVAVAGWMSAEVGARLGGIAATSRRLWGGVSDFMIRVKRQKLPASSPQGTRG